MKCFHSTSSFVFLPYKIRERERERVAKRSTSHHFETENGVGFFHSLQYRGESIYNDTRRITRLAQRYLTRHTIHRVILSGPDP